MAYKRENKSHGQVNKPKKGLTPGKVLYIYNLDDSFNLEAVQNLFQSIEPVEKIEYTEDNNTSGMVYFGNVEAAVKVLSLFKNLKVMKKTLKITFAEQKEKEKGLDEILNQPFSM